MNETAPLTLLECWLEIIRPWQAVFAQKPEFLGANHLIAKPGDMVPETKFKTTNAFTLFQMEGILPPGVSFHNSGSDGFFFRGAVPSDANRGYYPLAITATTNEGTKNARLFYFIVGHPPTYGGPTNVNFEVNKPVRFVISPYGLPKAALDGTPGMQTNFVIGLLPPGLRFGPGVEAGSLVVEGTPTELYSPLLPFNIGTMNGVPNPLFLPFNFHVIKPGDINRDTVVNCADAGVVRAALGKKRGFPGYDHLADINNDGIVDVRDLALVSRYLPPGTRCQ